MLAEDLTRAVSVLQGDSLQLRQTSSLGETLAWKPGIHSTYFGPSASRPVICGFGGDRIRLLRDGIDTLDASNTSPDHAVGVEPLLLERIEVIRGPSTLLYGNSAIGGVVNVIGLDRLSDLPERALQGKALFKYGTAADEKSGAIRAGGAVGKLGWKVGGLVRRTNDYQIPGRAEVAETEHEEHEEEHHAEEEEEHEEESIGILENSFINTESSSLGLAWFWD